MRRGVWNTECGGGGSNTAATNLDPPFGETTPAFLHTLTKMWRKKQRRERALMDKIIDV